MEKKFDTYVDNLKFRVLREVAKQAFEGSLLYNVLDIPRIIHPSKIPTMRCCVYKEREILSKRVKLAMGGDSTNPNVIEVIDVACDECPAAGYEVTPSCRGCLAHRCESVCMKGAISFDQAHVAHIDKSKCVECGKCASVCPFSAIINHKRPCQNACKVKAISINDQNVATINGDKCTACGACVYQCPFGAIMDKSFILDVINMLKTVKKEGGKLVAIIAPSVASQFSYATVGQVVSGLKRVGFTDVVEVAQGADVVALSEAKELSQKGFLISSCCPAFVKHVKYEYPELKKHISQNLSPMAVTGKLVKEQDPQAKVVFIGPCTAKKAEMQLEEVKPYIDSVLTFEELQAIFDSRSMDITFLGEEVPDDASKYGRTFARSGGLSKAVARALSEQNINFDLKPVICNGIVECRTALVKKTKNALKENFIEGMACEGGCIGGAGCLSHLDKNANKLEHFADSGKESMIAAAKKANDKANHNM